MQMSWETGIIFIVEQNRRVTEISKMITSWFKQGFKRPWRFSAVRSARLPRRAQVANGDDGTNF